MPDITQDAHVAFLALSQRLCVARLRAAADALEAGNYKMHRLNCRAADHWFDMMIHIEAALNSDHNIRIAKGPTG